MNSVQWIPTLMLVTLVAGLAAGLIALLGFLQRRSNRIAADAALTGGSSPHHGALPELGGLGAVVLAAIVLLTFGYNTRTDTKPTAGNPIPDTTGASATDQMSVPARPRANPAEAANPPTQYPLGSGSPATSPTNPAPSRANN